MTLSDPEQKKPPWLRVKMPHGEACDRIRELIQSKSLNTVCESALCPNMGECWSRGEATFMILGNACTRNCRFCAVSPGIPPPPDPSEAEAVADAVLCMGLCHAVVTSVTRDDLSDGGSGQFADTIRWIRQRAGNCTIEVLIPDFAGDRRALETVLNARPHVLGHNLETVKRLYSRVRPGADYRRSLLLLEAAKAHFPEVITKSGVMAGLGESRAEIEETLHDLRSAGCDILTIGQYLRPTKAHLPVARYYPPEEFIQIETLGYMLGFCRVAAGPLVRSSYHAGGLVRELLG